MSAKPQDIDKLYADKDDFLATTVPGVCRSEELQALVVRFEALKTWINENYGVTEDSGIEDLSDCCSALGVLYYLGKHFTKAQGAFEKVLNLCEVTIANYNADSRSLSPEGLQEAIELLSESKLNVTRSVIAYHVDQLAKTSIEDPAVIMKMALKVVSLLKENEIPHSGIDALHWGHFYYATALAHTITAKWVLVERQLERAVDCFSESPHFLIQLKHAQFALAKVKQLLGKDLDAADLFGKVNSGLTEEVKASEAYLDAVQLWDYVTSMHTTLTPSVLPPTTPPPISTAPATPTVFLPTTPNALPPMTPDSSTPTLSYVMSSPMLPPQTPRRSHTPRNPQP